MIDQVHGFLIDLDGVMYIEDRAIPGANDTVNHLRERGFPIRFLTNTTMKSATTLVDKLSKMGVRVERNEVFSTSVVTARWLAQQGVSRVHLVLTEDAQADFADFEITKEQPEVVVVGDLGKEFTFDVLNEAFLSLREGARLIALQKNRFWQTLSGPVLDAGPFVALLEYASEKEATLIGKPNRAYFETALEDMGLRPSDVIMVGDDAFTDIVGAKAIGIRTVLVKTGKYELDKNKPRPAEPDWVLESISDLPSVFT
jgi:HAD superfamily hydrolase (TIGR01458 family)